MKRPGPLWKCPECGHRFATKNLWHSCGNHALEDHFAGREANVRRAFDEIVAIARDCGSLTVYAQKSRIVLQKRVRFASVITRKRWLILGLWLRDRVEHPTFVGYEAIGTFGCYPKFRIEDAGQIDDVLRTWIRTAYTINAHP